MFLKDKNLLQLLLGFSQHFEVLNFLEQNAKVVWILNMRYNFRDDMNDMPHDNRVRSAPKINLVEGVVHDLVKIEFVDVNVLTLKLQSARGGNPILPKFPDDVSQIIEAGDGRGRVIDRW